MKGLYKDNKVAYNNPRILTRRKISKKHSQNLDRELGDEGPYSGTWGSIRNRARCDNWLRLSQGNKCLHLLLLSLSFPTHDPRWPSRAGSH